MIRVKAIKCNKYTLNRSQMWNVFYDYVDAEDENKTAPLFLLSAFVVFFSSDRPSPVPGCVARDPRY